MSKKTNKPLFKVRKTPNLVRFFGVIICSAILMPILSSCGKTLNNSEIEQLKANISVYYAQAHENVISYEAYQDAILLESFIVYTDVYDNSERFDTGHICSKYQLADGSIVYLNTYLFEMTGLGEMNSNHSLTGPFSEREEMYNAERDLATTGISTYYGGVNDPLELKKVSDGVYAHIKDGLTIYYFLVD